MTILELSVERAVPGGRMLARHDGIVVLVAGAIPGERVRAVVERRTRSLIWAKTVEILVQSEARREPPADPACGGLDYAHIHYPEQLRCKAEVVADALRRIGRIELEAPVSVMASEARGYRLRARLHVQRRRVGFFREGTHDLCDAATTDQLRPETMAAVGRVMEWLGRGADELAALIVSENVPATERVMHLEARDGRDLGSLTSPASDMPGVSGLTMSARGRLRTLAGRDHVADSAVDLFGADPPVPASTRWIRRGTSFFQANRYLIGALVRQVLVSVSGPRVIDLYAGVGLFAVACAASGLQVTAVEGEASAAGDLLTNAAAWPGLHAVHGSVEEAVSRLTALRPDTVVLDPPRTGATTEALEGVCRLGARRIVYVSCDPPTLARDAATLTAAGYRVGAVRAFDLFPNTAHVETVAIFDATSR